MGPTSGPTATPRTGLDNAGQIDRLRHRLVALIVGVKTIIPPVILSQSHGMLGIPGCTVEIDDAVKLTAFADKSVERLPRSLGTLVKSLRGKRRQRAADDLGPVQMQAADRNGSKDPHLRQFP